MVVLFEVRTGFLNIIQSSFVFKGLGALLPLDAEAVIGRLRAITDGLQPDVTTPQGLSAGLWDEILSSFCRVLFSDSLSALFSLVNAVSSHCTCQIIFARSLTQSVKGSSRAAILLEWRSSRRHETSSLNKHWNDRTKQLRAKSFSHFFT
jgi:hypothetical protein